jgi:hypothetical protein
MSTLYTLGPVASVDWDEVDFVHCTLEAPWLGGGLRFRLGTKDAKRNLDYNPNDRKNRNPYFPGTPIMYPEAAPAVAGTPSASWIMPASRSSMTVGRNGQPIPNGAAHSGFVAFGYFMAPVEEEDGLVGFTLGHERTRVAQFWAGYKFPSDKENKGRTGAQMNRIAAPDVPDVTVRPLSKQMQPITVDGVEVAIRVREFWNFNDPAQYDTPELPQLPASNGVADLLQGLTAEELKHLVAIARRGAASGKTQG